MMSKSLVPLGKGRMYCWGCRHEVNPRRPYVGIRLRKGVMRVWHADCAPKRTMAQARRNACKTNPSNMCARCGFSIVGKPQTIINGKDYCRTCAIIIKSIKKNPKLKGYKSNDGDWIRKGIMYKGPLVPGGVGGVDFRVVMWGAKRHGDKMEYGTHHMFFPTTGEPYFAYGHYFGPKMQSALADFNKRVREYKSNPKKTKKNPWHHAGTFRSSREARRLAKSFSIESFPTRLTKAGAKGTGVEYYTQPETPAPYTPEWFEYMEKVKSGALTERLGPEAITPAPMRWGVGTARARLRRERALFRQMFPFESYPFGKGKGKANPRGVNYKGMSDKELMSIAKVGINQSGGFVTHPTLKAAAELRKRGYKVSMARHTITKKNPYRVLSDPLRGIRRSKLAKSPKTMHGLVTKSLKRAGDSVDVEKIRTDEYHRFRGFGGRPKWRPMSNPKSPHPSFYNEKIKKEALKWVKKLKLRPEAMGGAPLDWWYFIDRCEKQYRKNPYLVRGVRKGRYMEKPIRSRKAARRALGRLGRHSQKIKITEREYRRISGWGGHGPRPLRKWRPVGQVMLTPGTYKVPRLKRGKYKNNPHLIGMAKKEKDAERIAYDYMRKTKKPAGLVFSPRQRIRAGSAHRHLNRPAMWEVVTFDKGQKLIGVPRGMRKGRRRPVRESKIGEWFWKHNPRRGEKTARKLWGKAGWWWHTSTPKQKEEWIRNVFPKMKASTRKMWIRKDWGKIDMHGAPTLGGISMGKVLRYSRQYGVKKTRKFYDEVASMRMPKKVHAGRTLSGHRLPYLPKNRKRGSDYAKIFGPFRKSKRYRRNIAPLVVAAALSAAPIIAKHGGKLVKRLTKKKNPKRLHPAYSRMQRGLRRQYLQRGERALLKSMKRNPKRKIKRMQRIPRAKKMAKHEIEGFLKYAAISRRLPKGRGGRTFRSMATQELGHANRIVKMKRKGYIQNRRPSAARREELRSKLSKLKRGQSVRPPKEWWAGKGKKRGMLKKISTSPKYRGRSHTAKARITAGIWHKGYSRPAKIRTVQKIMSGRGGIPNPPMTRRELILKAQEAEDNYMTTGKTHYKMVAMQIRDELAATATLRARQPIPAKHYPKPTYDRCNQGHLLQEVYDERYNEYRWDCLLCMSRMQNNPLGPTLRRVPRGIAKHVRRVARTRRPIVRGRNYFTPARGGVQVFRGKKASFVEV